MPQQLAKPQPSHDRLLTVDEVGERLNLKRNTINKMRLSGRGPTFVKCSESCYRYPESKLEEWIASRTVTPGAEAVA